VCKGRSAARRKRKIRREVEKTALDGKIKKTADVHLQKNQEIEEKNLCLHTTG
jgi:hypothetical protein